MNNLHEWSAHIYGTYSNGYWSQFLLIIGMNNLQEWSTRVDGTHANGYKSQFILISFFQGRWGRKPVPRKSVWSGQCLRSGKASGWQMPEWWQGFRPVPEKWQVPGQCLTSGKWQGQCLRSGKCLANARENFLKKFWLYCQLYHHFQFCLRMISMNFQMNFVLALWLFGKLNLTRLPQLGLFR